MSVSTIIPATDVAPSLPKRVVTMDFGNLAAGQDFSGETVTFWLGGNVRVPADGAILGSKKMVVRLDPQGKGSIRLPTYSTVAKADTPDREWCIFWKTSWDANIYAIRVPAGATPIALSSIEPIRGADSAISQWLLTSAGVTVSAGAQWGATVDVTGGVATFKFTVPPGGTAWSLPTLNFADLDTVLSPGVYPVGTVATNAPVGLVGTLEVIGNANYLLQRFTTWSASPLQQWVRRRSGGVWQPWELASWNRGLLGSAVDLDTVMGMGTYGIQSTTQPNLPAPNFGSLEVLQAVGHLIQRYTTWEGSPRIFLRRRVNSTTWDNWTQVSGADPTIGATVSDLASRVTALEQGSPVPKAIATLSATPTARAASDIMVAMSPDRTRGYNGYGGTLKTTTDGGLTWSNVRTFTGETIEAVIPLDDGEVLVSTATTSTFMRRMWRSTGLPGGSPTWATVLAFENEYVKLAPGWSTSAHKNIVLLAEYGPKSGMAWGESSNIAVGKNARYVHMSLDYGKTWRKALDLNAYLTGRGRPSTDVQHLHGVAWDPYWDRIWVCFGDNSGGNGSNGVLYSDDLGVTWQTAHFYSSAASTWQVTTIVPMRNVILFGGDMNPSGLMRIKRSEGKKATGTYTVDTAYTFPGPGTHLSQAWLNAPMGDGTEITMFGFGSEGSAAPSFIVGTRDGFAFKTVWQDTVSQQAGYGLRSITGPTLQGELICASNDLRDPILWSEIRGRFPGY